MKFNKCREFVYRNARPFALSLWKYYFEKGSKEEVLEMLSFYQNEDGGFGHGIEADFWNPNSTNMATWQATEIIAKIGGVESSHPIIKGILKYLDGGDGFHENTQQWTYTSPSNNEYPHAIWWEYKGEPEGFLSIPNAAFAGFIILYGEEDSSLYKKGCEMAVRSFEYLADHCNDMDEHEISSYQRLYDCCLKAGKVELFDMDKLQNYIKDMVNRVLCMDVEKWGKEYVPMPSTFIHSKEDFLYKGKEELITKECELIKKQQKEDGSFQVPWIWYTDYKEYEVASNWWKSEIIIDKLLFLRCFDE